MNTTTPKPITKTAAIAAIKQLPGMTANATGCGQEIRVRYRDAKPGEGYFTTDAADALATAQYMAQQKAFGTLCDYKTGNSIRPASESEWRASREAERSNIGGGTGVIEIDGRSVYVEGGPELDKAAQQASHTPYQPKTGARCSCRRGVQRDNCHACEGTGFVIDFAAIRARRLAVTPATTNP